MIATPGQRNRLTQKLKAETWIRRKNGTEGESGTDEINKSEGGALLGTLSPDPWHLSR